MGRSQPAAATRTKREVGETQLQRHPAGRKRLPAQARRHSIALGKQYPRQLGLIRDIAIKRGLARDALRFALGLNGAVVAAVGEAPETQTVLTQAQDRFPLVDPLQIADHAKA